MISFCCSSNNVGSDKKQVKPERRRDSFQDFEAKTKDAWDDGDDDLLKMAVSNKQTTSNQRRGGATGHSALPNSLENNSSHQESTESAKYQSLQSLQNASSASGDNIHVLTIQFKSTRMHFARATYNQQCADDAAKYGLN